LAAQKLQNKVVQLGSSNPGMEKLLMELRRRIVSQELLPGARLREQDLASEFGVSRARIRETFGILEERGLIERIPNRGAIVTRLEADKIKELFEVREVLEAQMVRLATEKAPPETWDSLIDLFGPSMDETLERNDFDAYAEANYQFRRQCIAAADNEVLSNLLDSLYDRTMVLIRRLVLVPGRAQEGIRQHREILAAMRAGKAEQAERLKRANIRSARDWFKNYQKYLM
jgi:DNA-binding GntR family transcriptional regulator